MSGATIVKRGLGNRPGPDIVDPLLTTDRLRVARGRAEIDHEYTDRELVTAGARHVGWVPPGTLVQVTDIEVGVWRGVVDRCEVVFALQGDNQFTADTNLVVEREVQK